MLKLPTLSSEEEEILESHFKKSGTHLIRSRAHAILLFSQGRSAPDIASILRFDEGTVRDWLKAFEHQRIASIFPAYAGNTNASKLTKEQREEIRKTLSEPPSEKGLPGSFWSVKTLRSYLSAEYGAVYESDRSYHHLFALSGYSYKLPDAFDRRRDDALVERRMKEIAKEIRRFPDREILCSDESSIVWETELRRAWLRQGEKTVLKVDRIKERQSYFGALNMRTGRHDLIPLSWQNTGTMIEALRELSKRYRGKKLLIVWDNARWHRGKELRELLGKGKEFEHIRFIWLPPYAPDKNPEEHVWKYGKEVIANRTYETFAELKREFENAVGGKKFDYKM